MTTAEDRTCVCGHPESEHTLQGECAVHRRDGIVGSNRITHECGCTYFTPWSEEDVP